MSCKFAAASVSFSRPDCCSQSTGSLILFCSDWCLSSEEFESFCLSGPFPPSWCRLGSSARGSLRTFAICFVSFLYWFIGFFVFDIVWCNSHHLRASNCQLIHLKVLAPFLSSFLFPNFLSSNEGGSENYFKAAASVLWISSAESVFAHS